MSPCKKLLKEGKGTTDAPKKPVEYSIMENTIGTNGASIVKDLFCDGIGKQAILDHPTDYLNPMISKVVGGRYKIFGVLHRSDDAPKRDLFAKGLPIIHNNGNDENDENENNRSSQSTVLPPRKRLRI